LLTAGGYDGTARVWDALTGESVAVLSGGKARVVRAVFSPDGKRVAMSSYDHSVRIFESGSWKPDAVLRGHEEEVWRVSFSSDGKSLLTGSNDRAPRLWDTGSWKTIRRLAGKDALFSPDGRRIVTADDSAARLYDAKTGRVIATLSADVAAFSADGALLVTASGTTAKVWDAATGRGVATLEVVPPGAGSMGATERRLTGIAFSPDGQWLLTACNDEMTRIFPRERFAPVDELLALAHKRATRALTAEERVRYLHVAAPAPKTQNSRLGAGWSAPTRPTAIAAR
jgi:WD40 repeat protein